MPEIAAMQTRAVIKAALKVKTKHPDWESFHRNHDSSYWRQRIQLCEIHCS